jgi:hypothetical protein
MQVRHQVLPMQNSDNIVENALINRESGVARIFYHKDNFIKRSAGVDRRHFHARNHYVFDLALRELENPLEHALVVVSLGRPRLRGVLYLGIAPKAVERFRDFRSVFDQGEVLGHGDFATRLRDSLFDPILDFQLSEVHHRRQFRHKQESGPIEHSLLAER